MNREDIIRMAREAGIRDCTCSGEFGCLERFAALVSAAAVASEREACAKVCDALHYEVDAYGAQCAAAIRERSSDLIAKGELK